MKKDSEKAIRFQKAFFWVVTLVCFFSFTAFTLWGKDGLFDLMDLFRQKEKISHQNKQIIQANLELLEEIQKLKKKEYIEQQIRSDMGYIRKNEVVFIVNE